MAELLVEIAGWRFGLRVEHAPLTEQLQQAYAAFRVGDTAGEVLWIDVRAEGPLVTSPSRARPLPRVRRLGAAELHVEGEDFRGRLGASGGVVTQRAQRFPVDSLLKLAIAERLRGEGGLLVHGVSVAHDGRAALFTGPSGAGKSTLANVCREAGLVVLADELCVVRKGAGGYEVFGTPWNVGSPGGARLLGVGVLAHAAENALQRHPEAEVLRTLLSNVLLVEEDARVKADTFRAATELLREVNTWEFAFRPDLEAGKVLQSMLAGATA